jgi:hypothetical protein
VKDVELCPEQLLSAGRAGGGALLIDQWGRAHMVGERALLGRDPETRDILVLQSSISRQHAEVARDEESGLWTVCDCGSTNGTFVEKERVTEPVPTLGM